jgi:hypothetical protein
MDNVTAIFETRYEADMALMRLEGIGVLDSQISVIATDEARANHFSVENTTKAEEGASAGAVLGGLAGAVAMAVTSAGALAIPGLNLIVSGYLVSAVAGLGAGAAAGGFLGALIGLGFPEHEAKLYEEALRTGNILIAVDAHNSEQKKHVKEIFTQIQDNKTTTKPPTSKIASVR